MDTQVGDFVIPNFQFNNGDVLDELRLHYTTLGEPKRDENGVVHNAVLIMHGTGGSGQQFMREQFAGRVIWSGSIIRC